MSPLIHTDYPHALTTEDDCPIGGHKRVVECLLMTLNNLRLRTVSQDVDRKNFVHVALEFQPGHDFGLIDIHYPHTTGAVSETLGDRDAVG